MPKQLTSDFTLTIYSSAEVFLYKVDDQKNIVINHCWDESTAGGSHLYSKEFEKQQSNRTWHSNPKFLLNVQNDEIGSTRVKIDFSRPEKAWRKMLAKSQVSCMVGL